MSPRKFDFTLHVPYAHIDKMGVVYYANYFVYFEMARSAMFREAGLPYGKLEERGVMLPVVAAHCEYRKAARLDEEICITVSNLSQRGAVLRAEYEVKRGADLLAVGYTDHVCMSPQGTVLKPVPELKRIMGVSP
jgi:acyl-CoA thioester hydrolase